MKKLINTIKTLRLIKKYPDLLNIVSHIFKTLEDVSADGSQRSQKITIDFNHEKLPKAEIGLWVCRGKQTPIDRIAELKKELEELKLEHLKELVK